MKRLPLWHTAVIIGYRIFFLEKKNERLYADAANVTTQRIQVVIARITRIPPPLKKKQTKMEKTEMTFENSNGTHTTTGKNKLCTQHKRVSRNKLMMDRRMEKYI